MDVEGCGRLTVHDSLLVVAWLCEYKLCGSLAREVNVNFVVVVGASCVGR